MSLGRELWSELQEGGKDGGQEGRERTEKR